MPQILRKQCVNILFQLGVFFDINRKSHFHKTLIISILTQQQNITKYHFKILIIWRSLVQAQAGPQKENRFCGSLFFILYPELSPVVISLALTFAPATLTANALSMSCAICTTNFKPRLVHIKNQGVTQIAQLLFLLLVNMR